MQRQQQQQQQQQKKTFKTYCDVNNLQMNRSICLKLIPVSIWGKSLLMTLFVCPDELFGVYVTGAP